MIYYLLTGIGFYIGLAITRRDTFKKATVWSIIRGILLGIVLWPIGIYVAYKSEYDFINICQNCEYYRRKCYLTKFSIGEVVTDDILKEETVYIDENFGCKCWKKKQQ